MLMETIEQFKTVKNRSSHIVRYENTIHENAFESSISRFKFLDFSDFNSQDFAQLLKDISANCADEELNILVQSPDPFNRRSWSGCIGGVHLNAGWSADDYVRSMNTEGNSTTSLAFYYGVVSMFIIGDSYDWAFCVDRDWGIIVFGMRDGVELSESILKSELWINHEDVVEIVIGNSEDSGIYLERRHQLFRSYGITNY